METYDKTVQLAIFDNKVLDQLCCHGSISDIDDHGIADATQQLNLLLDPFELIHLSSCNDDDCAESGQFMGDTSSNAFILLECVINKINKVK